MTKHRPSIAAIGMFDGVHAGHRDLARRLCARAAETGLCPMALTFDRHPLELVRPEWTPRLLTDPEQRRRLLEQCGIAEVVDMTFDQEMRRLTAREFMTHIRDTYNVRELVMGYDHHFGSDRLKDLADYQAIGDELGMTVDRCPEYRVDGLDMTASSSNVRRLLDAGNVADAARMLCRPHSITGKVVEGKRLGNTIGFPTANIDAAPRMLVPANGVYAGTTVIDGVAMPAMTNIGTCPTVSDDAARTIETHIPGFDGDLYGKTLTVTFEHRLRDEQRFDSLTDLVAQLESDRQATLKLFSNDSH